MIRLSAPFESPSLPETTHLARPIGIDTYQELVLYMRADCPVCKSEGFESQSRVRISGNGKSLVATLNVVRGDLLNHGEAGLSEMAWLLLGSNKPCQVTLSHPDPVKSFSHVRAKLFGHPLTAEMLNAVVHDIVQRQYTDVQLSAFIASCVGDRMTDEEVVMLTQAMVSVGKQLDWDGTAVFDKHCVGGLPGNRTTPIVVAIVAACGVIMPKTSSRAITSPAGTADTMETLTRVDLSLDEMRRVVEQENACLVWGGSANLSPADDVLIRIERALDVDSDAQLVASVLSKKIAAGSTHVLIDIPTGPTAKVRNQATADGLSTLLKSTGDKLGIKVETVVTDGNQPVGCGIGPALEARDVLAVLQCDAKAPADLRERSAFLAGKILEISGRAHLGDGYHKALKVLDEGGAWKKFKAICEAQGGLKTPPIAEYQYVVVASLQGRVQSIDNRRLAKIAKLAGAPSAVSAGVYLHVHLNDIIEDGDPVFTVHAEAPGEMTYALSYLSQNLDLISIEVIE